jgi:hypothetical protein
LKALLARKEQLEGPKSFLEYPGGAVGPGRRFEGPKSHLECLEGAAGPKGAIRGTKVLEYLESAAVPKRRFEYNFDPKISLEGQKTKSSKNSVYIRMAQKRGAQKISKKTQSKGCLSARGAYL